MSFIASLVPTFNCQIGQIIMYLDLKGSGRKGWLTGGAFKMMLELCHHSCPYKFCLCCHNEKSVKTFQRIVD